MDKTRKDTRIIFRIPSREADLFKQLAKRDGGASTVLRRYVRNFNRRYFVPRRDKA